MHYTCWSSICTGTHGCACKISEVFQGQHSRLSPHPSHHSFPWRLRACFAVRQWHACLSVLMWSLEGMSDISCWLVQFWVALCDLVCWTLFWTNRKSRKQFNVDCMYTHCIYLSYGELTSAVVLLFYCTSSLVHSPVTFYNCYGLSISVSVCL